MKRVVSLWLCLSLLLVSCAGLAEGEKETINFWYLWAGEEEIALKAIIEEYNAQSDKYAVKASLCDIPKQIAGMASKTGPDITDIVDNSVANLASKGILLNLDEYIAGEPEMMADFLPSAMRQCAWNGSTWGLPINAMVSMNYYNKKAFAEAGIEKVPETWDEFKDAIHKLTIVDDAGNLVQSGWPWTNSVGYMDLVPLLGGSLYNEGMTEVTPDDPVMLEILNFARDYSEQYGVDNIRKFNASLGGWISAQDPFFVGKQAMCASGWYLSHYIELTGHSDDLDWGVFPMPGIERHKGAGRVGTSIFVVPARGKNPEGAWDFMKYLMAPDKMARLMAAFHNEPARFSAGKDPALAGLPAFQDFFQLASDENSMTFPGHAIESEYSQALGVAVGEVIALTKTPEEAMADVKAKIQPALDKANR